MNNLPLQPLAWDQSALTHTAESPLHSYVIRYDELEGAYLVDYYERMTGEHGDKFCKTVDEAKHWIETDHYPSKMQPYVKPSPTWIDYKTEKPKEGDNIVITWLWMGDRHTVHLSDYSPRRIDCLDDAIEVYWSISPFITNKGE